LFGVAHAGRKDCERANAVERIGGIERRARQFVGVEDDCSAAPVGRLCEDARRRARDLNGGARLVAVVVADDDLRLTRLSFVGDLEIDLRG
jgi:hypothetical protein